MGSLTISMVRIYLDANAVIDSRESSAGRGPALRELIIDVRNIGYSLVTSELTLAEVLVVPLRGLVDRSPEDEDPESRELHDWYLANLKPEHAVILTLPMTQRVLVRAALIRARVTGIKLPDAIHVATAIEGGASYFLTADRRLEAAFMRDGEWVADPKLAFVSTEDETLRAFLSSLSS
jgi:predicted nucleic acid-binding protein